MLPSVNVKPTPADFILPIKIYEPYAVITTFKRTKGKLYDTIDEIIKLI